MSDESRSHSPRPASPLTPTHPSRDARLYVDRAYWPQLSLGALFAQTVERQGARDAIIDGPRRFPFREIDRLSEGLARAFARFGVGPGDVIAYQLPNWWEAVVAFLGALRVGAVVTPLLPSFREAELRFTLRQSRARALIIPGVWRGCDHRSLVRSLRAELPGLEHVFVARAEPVAGMRSFEACLEEPAPHTTVGPDRVDPDGLALIMYTSGTTAQPKGVLHTHNTLAAEVLSLARVHQLCPDDRTLMPSPLGHISGVIHGILVPAVLGTSAVLMERWQPAEALELMVRERVTYMVGAPTFLQDLVAQPEEITRRADTLRLFSCGGAGVSPALIAAARQRFPRCVAKRVYGSSEFPSLATTDASDAVARGGNTEGRAIWPAAVRIVDESGSPVAPGTEGEVQASGPECFVGYVDAALNAEAFTDDGWFRTGDLGSVDAEGYLRITGRIKDIIIRKGEKISVKELEDVIALHPGVAEVAVVALPDAATGERACAVVQLRAEVALDLAGLAEFLAAKGIAKLKWPEQIECVQDFPRTESGKIMRGKLKEQLQRRRAGSAG